MEDFYCTEIITGNINVHVIFETELVMAFHHTNPYFEIHIVIIPKMHINSLSVYPHNNSLSVDFFKAIQFVTKQVEDQFGGCKISSNIGNYQTTKHLHWYVHSGKRLRTEDGQLIENNFE